MLSKPWRPNTKTRDKAMFISHFWNQQVWVNVSGQLKWFKTPLPAKPRPYLGPTNNKILTNSESFRRVLAATELDWGDGGRRWSSAPISLNQDLMHDLDLG